MSTTTFVQQLREIYNVNRPPTFEEREAEVLDKLFTQLTEKYHLSMKQAFMEAAEKGRNEKFMNFCHNDFKANFPGLTPKKVAQLWMKEMVNPYSDYVPKITEPYGYDGLVSIRPDHFEGLGFDVWGNAAFTIKFWW